MANIYQRRMAAASLLAVIVSAYPVLFSSFPVLLRPVSDAFGWGRGEMSLGLMAASIAATIMHPIIGRQLDKYGSRAVLLPGYAIFGLSVILLALNNGQPAVLIALYVLAGAANTLATGTAFGRAISLVFVEKRGLMLGLCLGVGGGIGSAIMPLIAGYFIERFGWRGAYVGLGLLPIFIGLPILFVLMREPPVSLAASDPAPGRIYGLSFAEAARSPALWIMLLSIFFTTGVISGTIAHFVAIAGDRGIAPANAAMMLTYMAGALVLGQIFIGLALDRVRSPVLIRPVYLGILAGVLLINFSFDKFGLGLGIATLGFSAGSEYGLLPYYLTRIFGMKSFGVIYGIVFAVATLANGIGPATMGLTFDRTGSYSGALLAFEIVTLVSALLMFAAIRQYAFHPDGKPLEAR